MTAPAPQYSRMRLQPFLVALLVAPVLPVLRPAAGADAEAPDRVTYEDDVHPILRQHCFACHNQNEQKGGLALDSYASAIEGGAGGEVVYDGDADSSRLWQLISHEDTPVMPPGQDKLDDETLDVVRRWIDGGLLENAGSKAKKKKASGLAFSASTDGRPEGPAAMPETVWKQPSIVTERPAAATALRCSPWGPLLAVAGQQQVVLYNTDTGQLAGVLPFPEGTPLSLTFSRDGSYLLVGGGQHSSLGTTVLYDVRTGDRVARVGDELDVVLGADTNDTLTRIALGGPQRLVRIHDVAGGDVAFELKKHTDWIYDVRFSPDGILVASADRAGGLVVWEADTGRLYADFAGHKDGIRALAWRADSNLLASASLDGTVKLWDILNSKELKSFNAHGGGVTSIDIARDGRIITSGKDRLVKLWDASGTHVRDFPAMPEAVLEVAFTHDGSGVIAGDWSGEIRMWKTDNPEETTVFASNPPTLQDRLAAAQQEAEQTAAAETAAVTSLATAEETLATTTATLATLKEKLEANRTAAVAAATAANEAKVAADAAAEKLAAASQPIETLKMEIAALQEQMAKATAEEEEAAKTLARLESATVDATKARDAAAAELESLDAQLAELQTDAAANAEKIAEHQEKRAAAAERHRNQIAAIEANGSEIGKASENRLAAVEELRKTKEMLTSRQREMGAAQAAVAEARLTKQTSSAAAASTAAELTRLEAEIAGGEQQIAETEQQLVAATARRDEAKPAAAAATAAHQQSAAKVAEIQADLEAFLGEHERLTTAAETARKTLAEQLAIAEAKQAEAAELATKLSAEDEKLQALREQLEQLQSQVSELKSAKRELETAQSGAAEAAEAAEAEASKIEDRRSLYETAYPGS